MKTAKQLKPYQFKPGQSGNPAGRPRRALMSDQIRYAKYADFLELVDRLSSMTKMEISDYLQRPEATMFELIYGTLIAQSAKGDWRARQELSDRIFGRSKELQPETDDDRRRKELESLSNDQLIDLVKETIIEVQPAKQKAIEAK